MHEDKRFINAVGSNPEFADFGRWTSQASPLHPGQIAQRAQFRIVPGPILLPALVSFRAVLVGVQLVLSLFLT